MRLGRLYFGNTLSEGIGTIQPWPADEEVLIETPPAHDPDIKRTALASISADDFNFETTSAPLPPVDGMPVDGPFGGGRRNGRRQGRGDRRRQAAEDAGRAAQPRAARSAPSRRSASPRRSISNPAAR